MDEITDFLHRIDVHEEALSASRIMAFDLIERLKDRVQAPTSVKVEQDFYPDSKPYLTVWWGEGSLLEDNTVMVIIGATGWGIFHSGKCTHVDRENIDEVALVLESKINTLLV